MNTPTREEMNARFEGYESRMDARFAHVDGRFAHLESTVHKAVAEMIKWVAGIVIASSAIQISIVSFLVSNPASKQPGQPLAVVLPAASTNPSSETPLGTR